MACIDSSIISLVAIFRFICKPENVVHKCYIVKALELTLLALLFFFAPVYYMSG